MAAGRLRRRRRPRRRARPRAASAGRRPRPLLRRHAHRCHRAPRACGVREGQPRAADRRRGPRHGAGARQARRHPLAHLVHQLRRPPGGRALRRPARAHGPLARAATAVEGRAARRRLPRLVVGRGVGVPRGRGDHRGVRRHEGRPARRLSVRRSGARARRAQRHRHPRLAPGHLDRPDRGLRRRRVAAVRRVRRAHHAPEGHQAPAGLGRAPRPRGAARLLRLGTGHPGDRRRDRDGRGRPAGDARRRLDQRAREPCRGDAAAHQRAGLPVPVGLRAARHREPRGHGVRDRRGRLRRRRHPRGRGRGRDRACSCTTTPTTPRASSARSPRRSTPSCATRSGRSEMGRKGRERAQAHFGWDVVARQTVEVYLAAGAVPGAVAP